MTQLLKPLLLSALPNAPFEGGLCQGVPPDIQAATRMLGAETQLGEERDVRLSSLGRFPQYNMA